MFSSKSHLQFARKTSQDNDIFTIRQNTYIKITNQPIILTQSCKSFPAVSAFTKRTRKLRSQVSYSAKTQPIIQYCQQLTIKEPDKLIFKEFIFTAKPSQLVENIVVSFKNLKPPIVEFTIENSQLLRYTNSQPETPQKLSYNDFRKRKPAQKTPKFHSNSNETDQLLLKLDIFRYKNVIDDILNQ